MKVFVEELTIEAAVFNGQHMNGQHPPVNRAYARVRPRPQTAKNLSLSAFQKDFLGQTSYKCPIQQSLNTRHHFVLKFIAKNFFVKLRSYTQLQTTCSNPAMLVGGN